jgi:hypothetical protein
MFIVSGYPMSTGPTELSGFEKPTYIEATDLQPLEL